ncbi:MAG: YkgJ family cysteine cluster protein [Eudoraea sp.]|nr:YkgJ family cysteine cluster protein [Eudoraea sp.]
MAGNKRKENKRFFSLLKKKPPKGLDALMAELHEAEFQKTDCLDCANCCRTTGPLFTQTDIERLSKFFKIRPAHFIDTYLRVDEDNDYVLQSVPCPFLGSDNYCSVYDQRPKACREFPHTNQRKFQNRASLNLKNVAICPAAYNIVEALKQKVDF